MRGALKALRGLSMSFAYMHAEYVERQRLATETAMVCRTPPDAIMRDVTELATRSPFSYAVLISSAQSAVLYEGITYDDWLRRMRR